MYRIRAFLDTFGELVAVEAGTAVTLGGVLADRQDVVRTMDAGASEGETVGEGDGGHEGSFIVQIPLSLCFHRSPPRSARIGSTDRGFLPQARGYV